MIVQLGALDPSTYLQPGWIETQCYIGPAANWPGYLANQCSERYAGNCQSLCGPETCAGGNEAACKTSQWSTAPVAPVSSPTVTTAPAQAGYISTPKTVTSDPVKTVTVQTADGGTVEVAASDVPGVEDQALTVPTMVHVPNVWDSLDPTKESQFKFSGGPATALPYWISDAWREKLATAASSGATMTPAGPTAAAAAPAGDAGVPLLGLALVAGIAWMLRDKKGGRR